MSKDNGGPASDRELLEMAAKAAGVDGQWSDYHNGICYSKKGSLDMHVWRPLTDDGEALRLAYALGMQLNLDDCNDINDLRTEIVRAAAAIGSAM